MTTYSLSARLIVAAARAFLADREQRIEAKRAALINEVLQRKTSWLGRLFRLSEPTKWSAIVELEAKSPEYRALGRPSKAAQSIELSRDKANAALLANGGRDVFLEVDRFDRDLLKRYFELDRAE